MAGQAPRALGAAFLFVIAFGASAAFGQGRTWVDPPSGAPAQTPAAAPKKPDSPAATQAPRARSGAQAAPEQAAPAPKAERAAPVRRAQAAPRPQRSVATRAARPARTVARTETTRRAAMRTQRPRFAARSAPSRRIRTVRDALQAGYVAMRLRTIEYPDGSRVNVLVQPDGSTMRSLMSGPLSRRPVALRAR